MIENNFNFNNQIEKTIENKLFKFNEYDDYFNSLVDTFDKSFNFKDNNQNSILNESKEENKIIKQILNFIMDEVVENYYQIKNEEQKLIEPFIPLDNLKYISSKDQTKDWRKDQDWYENGKKNECELYQRNEVEKITKNKCLKTNMRINQETKKMESIINPLNLDNGFEYTENFDGVQNLNSFQLYYNLKFVCNAGGAQTRTLREVYHFITAQLEYLNSYKQNHNELKIYFINILDGDECYKRKKNFNYLLEKEMYSNVKNNIFCGDLFTFNQWFQTNFKE